MVTEYALAFLSALSFLLNSFSPSLQFAHTNVFIENNYISSQPLFHQAKSLCLWALIISADKIGSLGHKVLQKFHLIFFFFFHILVNLIKPWIYSFGRYLGLKGFFELFYLCEKYLPDNMHNCLSSSSLTQDLELMVICLLSHFQLVAVRLL